MKNIAVTVICIIWASACFAQRKFGDDFGNDEKRISRKLYPQVNLIRGIGVNDGIEPIAFDTFTHRAVNWLVDQTGRYLPDSVYRLKNYTRVVVENSVFLPFGDTMKDMGLTIFIISCDEKSYVTVFVEKGIYDIHFNRALREPGGMYSAREDPPILGVDPFIDQKTLFGLLMALFPPMNRETHP